MRLPTRPRLRARRARRALTSPAWHTWIRPMTSALGSQNQPRISEPGSAALSIHPLHPISHWGHCLSSPALIESTSGPGQKREKRKIHQKTMHEQHECGIGEIGTYGHKDRTGQSRTGRALAFQRCPTKTVFTARFLLIVWFFSFYCICTDTQSFAGVPGIGTSAQSV
jgi:hypothetical protein